MSERILAEGAIEVGHHTTAHWLGMTVNTDTVLATAIAAAITLALAFFLRANSNLYTSVRSRLIRFEYFDLLDPLPGHVARLNSWQPTILVGPPSLLALLAQAADAGRLSIAPRKVVAVGEVLDPLADACAALGRWDFMVVVAPLVIPGATGSPVNPIAIL